MTDPTPPVEPTEGATPEQHNTPAPPPAPPVGQSGVPQQQAPMNTLAIIAFIASFFISLAGIIMGHISLSQIKKTGERGRGFALAGTIIGYVALAGTVLAVVLSIVFAGIIAAAATSATNDLSQATEELESPELESPEPGATGDRTAEFCDAFMAANESGAASNDDGSLTAESLEAFQRLADTPSPNQAIYQRFVTVAKDPAALANDESPDTLMTDYVDAVQDDAAACLG